MTYITLVKYKDFDGRWHSSMHSVSLYRTWIRIKSFPNGHLPDFIQTKDGVIYVKINYNYIDSRDLTPFERELYGVDE